MNPASAFLIALAIACFSLAAYFLVTGLIGQAEYRRIVRYQREHRLNYVMEEVVPWVIRQRRVIDGSGWSGEINYWDMHVLANLTNPFRQEMGWLLSTASMPGLVSTWKYMHRTGSDDDVQRYLLGDEKLHKLRKRWKPSRWKRLCARSANGWSAFRRRTTAVKQS